MDRPADPHRKVLTELGFTLVATNADNGLETWDYQVVGLEQRCELRPDGEFRLFNVTKAFNGSNYTLVSRGSWDGALEALSARA